MAKAKPKIIYRTRTIYRDRPEDEQTTTATASVITTSKVNGWISSITIGDIRQWLIIMVPLSFIWWGYLGPQAAAAGEKFVLETLTRIGVDPPAIAKLNQNLTTLEETVGELAKEKEETKDAVQGLESKVDALIKVLEFQALQQRPVAAPPPAAPAQ